MDARWPPRASQDHSACSGNLESRNKRKHLGANDTASHRIQAICGSGWTQTQKIDTFRCHRDKSTWPQVHLNNNIVPCIAREQKYRPMQYKFQKWALSRSKGQVMLFQMQNKVESIHKIALAWFNPKVPHSIIWSSHIVSRKGWIPLLESNLRRLNTLSNHFWPCYDYLHGSLEICISFKNF